MRKSYPALLAVFLLFLSSIFCFSPAEAAEAIGHAEVLRGRVRVEDSGGEKKTLEEKGPLYAGDQVTTAWDGYLQARLLDETAFTIGPRSSITLDTYVFDPAAQKGNAAISVKGFFRFVTGKMVEKDPESLEVKMPVGVVGIRGTQVAGEAKGGSSFVVLEKKDNPALEGTHVRVANKGGETNLDEPGDAARVKKGERPGPKFKAGDEERKRLNQKLNPPDDGDAGGAFGDTVGVGQSGNAPDAASLLIEGSQGGQSSSEHSHYDS